MSDKNRIPAPDDFPVTWLQPEDAELFWTQDRLHYPDPVTPLEFSVIEEAVDRARADGLAVSSLHLTYLQPMASGIGEIFKQFGQVMTVEMSWSDDLDDDSINLDNRRYSNLAWLLRARYLVDVDCWSEVKGQPLKPGSVETVIRRKLKAEHARV